MIRFLQTEGPFKKIVLSGLLLLICAAMVIAFIPGNLGSDLTGTPGKGVVAKVAGEDITAAEVRETARGMLQQQGAQLGANASILLPYLKNPTTVRNLQLFTAFDVLTFPCIGRRASDVRLPIKNLQSLYSFPAENCGQVWARIAAGSSTYDHQTLDGWRAGRCPVSVAHPVERDEGGHRPPR